MEVAHLSRFQKIRICRVRSPRIVLNSLHPHRSSIGTLAAAYVNGLQSKGVAATIKHFVGNDQEHERTAADSVVSERALREIYLYPCAQPDLALLPLIQTYSLDSC